MLPPKQILLWAEREEYAGLLAFVLNTHHEWSVTKAANDRQFQALLSRKWDLVIVPHAVSPKRTENKAALVRRATDCPILVLTCEEGYPAPWPVGAAAVLPWGTSNAEILERVRILLHRKRGPKKHTKRAALAEVA